jgi:hypothetical protein
MARKSTADTAKDKAAKQKKIVIGLAVFLALAVAYAVNTMSGLNGAPASSKPQAVAAGAVAAPTAAPAASTPAPAAPSLAGTPVASTPVTAGSTTTASGTDSSQLVAVVISKADPGQLESFSRFESKDPFASASSVPTSGSGSGSGTKGSSGSSGSGSPPKTPPAPPAPPPTAAVISVNGTSESVTSGLNFPANNPVPSTNGLFQLVSLTAHSATITIVGGSYASGSQTLTLKENKPVTLVNTADGTRYTLVLYPQGTVAPTSPPAGASAPSAPSAPAPGTTTSGG